MNNTNSTARPRARGSRAALATGALLALLAAGGCGAGDSSSSDSSAAGLNAPAGDNKPAGERAGAGRAADGAKSDGGASAAPKARASATHVIRTATLSVEVESVPKAVAAARGATEDSGGLVANETTERVDDTHEVSHLVLRVPQDRYQAVLRELAGSGKLLSRSSNAKDVTDQVVDVESRIATQRASVARVRELMDQAGKLSDVVTLEGELSSRQAALESLLAQQASLEDRTSLATITLDLNEPEGPAGKADDEGPGFLDALGGGWDAFVTMLRWIAMAIGAAAPFLAVAAVLLLVWRRVRALRARRSAPSGPARPVPAAAPETESAPAP
ncbi:DUF4349 domain-containing protein [Streptomyces sp. BE147]|uniref:DUF4349 domain-containing protein n=1 Tax=Streptomyces sp. BE147 TaxID=3002524 RepID=UPI002E7808C7|nr:DUF4349 domain-containing protein [Streptomyces sp. BE147]MEE1737653.1 DUF4349 domain-containing protein [Streptomyces sp. BE147]